MKKIIMTILICTLFLLGACSKSAVSVSLVPDSFHTPELIAWFETAPGGLVPVKHKDSNLWGFLGANGEVVIEAIYDQYLPLKQSGGISVMKDGLWGFIDFEGNTVIPIEYSKFPAEAEGLIRLYDSVSAKYGFADLNGQLTIDFQYDEAYLFSEGVSASQTDGIWGYIDKNQAVVIPFQFEDAVSFHNGTASVMKEGLWGAINPEGDIILDYRYMEPLQFNKAGISVAKTEKGYTVIDHTGSELLDGYYEASAVDTELPLVYFGNDPSGMINLETGETIPYLPEEPFSEGVAAVYDENMLLYYIDQTGEAVHDGKYRFATAFQDGHAVVVDQENNGLIIDGEGNVVSQLLDNVATVSRLLDGVVILLDMDNNYYIASVDRRN